MSDRHPKWVRVQPGVVIPAGQPYRVETNRLERTVKATEVVHFVEIVADGLRSDGSEVFVDSSWRPPLELPTEPTWGIAVHVDPAVYTMVGRCRVDAGEDFWHPRGTWRAKNVADFIPLTDEQVTRIEAAQPSKFPSQEDAFR